MLKKWKNNLISTSLLFSLTSTFLIITHSNSALAVTTNPTPVCVANTCTITFVYSGDYYSWTVPDGVTSLTLDLYGAQGGSGNSAGGKGGRVSGDYAVSSGTTIYVYVGGQNGWNGGGAAGTGNVNQNGFVGGGGTDIRIGSTNLSDRKVVAGGGGGAGRKDCSVQPGGGGGYPGGIGGTGGATQKGGDGTNTNGGTVSGAYGGGTSCTSSSFGGAGGGQNGGGGAGGYGVAAGGSGGNCGAVNPIPSGGGTATNATGGCFGTGGNGGSYSSGAGGGGGGGWYGGGAGGANWASGGGGGSSYLGAMTNTSYVNATRSGDGYATLTYTATPDITSPTFTSSNSFSAAENITNSDNAATIKISESATVTISSGPDASLFNLVFSDSITVFIRFKTSPNYEAPSDSGANNVYDLTLTATDSASNAGTQSITITVTDVVDTSSFNTFALAGSLTTATYRSAVLINASVSVQSKITFRAANIIISGCKGKLATGSGSTFSASCSWKPSTRGTVVITATAVPTNGAISGTTANPINVTILNRSANR